MKAVFDDRQWRHEPQYFMANGVTAQPGTGRAHRAADRRGKGRGLRFHRAAGCGLGPIAAVHTPEYVTFLRNIYTRWQRMAESGSEVIPNIHPANRSDSYPKSAVGQAGYHQADTACPIGAHTWEAAYWGAQSAITAADLVAGGDRAAYALCRPPGHHAFSDLAGGFCFLNNAAIAADRLRGLCLRVAILDVDVHHGNGTQGIFYARPDVLTVSIHADPARFYPFFWGHADERGAGPGLGSNLNLPLPRGTGDDAYLDTLDRALERITNFGADAVVVALGLDAYEGDPFQGLAITTPGFARIGAAIAGLGLPTLFVQEGGYLCEELGQNLTAALTGFEESA